MRHLTFDKIAFEIFTGTIICELLLVGTYWFDALSGGQFQLLHSLFDLDGEANIPAWFSSVQLMVVALAFWTHALRQPRGLRPSKAFFGFAGCAALYASMDEAGQIHEQVTAWMGRRYMDWLPAYAGKHFWWVMIVVAATLGLIQLFVPDLLTIGREHWRFGALVVVGVCIGLGGAMGVETLGYKLLHGKRASLWYKAEVTLEEFMEMFGASLILFATLKLSGALAGKRLRATREMRKTRRTRTPSLAGAPSQ